MLILVPLALGLGILLGRFLIWHCLTGIPHPSDEERNTECSVSS